MKKPELYLTIDIGNSNIVIGFYRNSVWEVSRVPTHGEGYDAISALLRNKVDQIIHTTVSSVVPSATDKVILLLEQLSLTPYLIGKKTYEHLDIDVNNPEEIGTDLVANAYYAHHHYRNHRKVIIDLGTALTFTALNESGRIIGVAIAPGIKTAMFALFTNAEQLPEVPLEMPNTVLGSDTVSALQAGVLLGYIGLVEGMIKRIKSEIGEDCIVLGTGGLSFLMGELKHLFYEINPNLTIDGIRLIGEAVRK